MSSRSKYSDLIDALLEGNTVQVDADEDFCLSSVRSTLKRELDSIPQELWPAATSLRCTKTRLHGKLSFRLKLVAPAEKVCYTVVPETTARPASHEQET